MNKLRADHVAIPVFDAEATFHFYADVLGLELLEAYSGDDWGGRPWLMMIFDVGDGRQLALVALHGAKSEKSALPADVRHYAFSVAGAREQSAWKTRLRELGVEFWEEDHGAQKSIYFKDPSGVILEITTPESDGALEKNPGAADVVKNWIKAQR